MSRFLDVRVQLSGHENFDMVSQIEDLTTADDNFILPQEEEIGDVLFDEESLAHTLS